MSMNRWTCDHPECKSSCVGVGGAVGLRAIGWQVILRPHGLTVFCPAHREDQIPCEDNDENKGHPCSYCAAEREARRIQASLEVNG